LVNKEQLEELCLCGKFSYFNLDYFINLKNLTLEGYINEGFNTKLFRRLCAHLNNLYISFNNGGERLYKMLNGYRFSNLKILRLSNMNFFMKTLEKSLLDNYRMLEELSIVGCFVERIEKNAFSNLEYLIVINLSENLIENIDEIAFCNQKKLESLDLSANRLKYLDPVLIADKPAFKSIDLSNNNISKANFYQFDKYTRKFYKQI
jgi:hypothetical protein